MRRNVGRLELFNRMLGIVTEAELEALRTKGIAVAGCGGVGFTHAETLVRMGVGRVHVADPDTFSVENMNRQFGATMDTIDKPKVEVLRDRLLSINPNLHVSVFSHGINDQTVVEFLQDVHLVVDSMDYFVMDAPGEDPRLRLHRVAREKGLPAIISGPVGFGATLHHFSPEGMSFHDFFDVRNDIPPDRKLVNFGKGMIPGQLYRHYQKSPELSFEHRKVASLSCSCLLSSALIGAAGLLILLGRQSHFKPAPYCYQIDFQAGKFEEIVVPGGVRELDRNPSAFLR
jgi:molybdopterin/thiamine biosynthesis adenylyltransferase